MEEVTTVFWWILKKTGRTADLLWADDGENRYSVQCFSLVTFR